MVDPIFSALNVFAGALVGLSAAVVRRRGWRDLMTTTLVAGIAGVLAIAVLPFENLQLSRLLPVAGWGSFGAFFGPIHLSPIFGGIVGLLALGTFRRRPAGATAAQAGSDASAPARSTGGSWSRALVRVAGGTAILVVTYFALYYFALIALFYQADVLHDFYGSAVPWPGRTLHSVPAAHVANCAGVSARIAGEGRCLKLGDSFKDCPICPEMVVIPAGAFVMGTESDSPDTQPLREVQIGKPFAISRYEITFADWDACITDGGCRRTPEDREGKRGKQPVVQSSWNDIARHYLPWLRRRSGGAYGLPTEAEWEYVARSFSAFGLSDFYVSPDLPIPRPSRREWVVDCYWASYANLPTDGRAAPENGNLCQRVLRDGPRRISTTPNNRADHDSFRVVRNL